MIEKLIVICLPEGYSEESLNKFISLLGINSFEPVYQNNHQAIHSILKEIKIKYLKTDNKLDIEQESYVKFSEKVKSYVSNRIEYKTGYVISTHNHNFIDFWRLFSTEENIHIEFIALWEHPLSTEVLKEGRSDVVYNYLVTLLGHAGSDITTFYIDDIDDNKELCKQKLLTNMNLTAINDREELPVERLVSQIKKESIAFEKNLTFKELNVLNEVFSSCRYGTRFYVADKEALYRQFLPTLQDHSAVRTLLQHVSTYKESVILDISEQSLYEERINTLKNRIKAILKTNKSLREEIRNLRASIQELKSISQAPAKKNNQAPVKKNNQAPAKKNNQAPVKKNNQAEIARRKREKFIRDPYAFFNDSKNPIVRMGRFFVKKGN